MIGNGAPGIAGSPELCPSTDGADTPWQDPYSSRADNNAGRLDNEIAYMAVAAWNKILTCLKERREYDCQHNADKQITRTPTGKSYRAAQECERNTTFDIRRRIR